MKQHILPNGVIYESRAEDVYPLLSVGTISLVHVDGPYGINKAEWDRIKVSDLAAWYRPHIEAWGRLCAPSASIYHWGTAEGWAAVHPEYLRQGWTFRVLVTWDKGGTMAVLSSSSWPNTSEVCGYYVRGDAPFILPSKVTAIWRMSQSEYSEEKARSDRLICSIKDGYQWNAPLHPCQKPLKFADRIIRASSRPGDIILEPFGGTCRIAVACEQVARYKPADVRHYIVIEMNADGVDYIGPVLRHIEQSGKQVTLFEKV